MTTYRPIRNGGGMVSACKKGELERVQAHGDGGGDLNLVDSYGWGGWWEQESIRIVRSVACR